jgi:hypothetical protein
MYDRLVSKRQRDKRLAEQKEQDVQVWLLIGAIFIGTMLAVYRSYSVPCTPKV